MPHTDREQRKEYHRRYYRRNREKALKSQRERDAMKSPEVKRAYRRAYYQANRERLLEQQRIRGRANYRAKPERYAQRTRKGLLKRKFGLTEAEYMELLRKQSGCAICGASPDPGKKKFPVDHCHKTGTVRGILCGNCNRALGLFRDSPELLTKAVEYLTRSSSGVTSMTNRTRSKPR